MRRLDARRSQPSTSSAIRCADWRVVEAAAANPSLPSAVAADLVHRR
ncbi:hypothetical protein [Streptomyces sp. NPDC007074]